MSASVSVEVPVVALETQFVVVLVQESGESRLLVTVGHVRAHPLQHLLWAGGGRGKRGGGREEGEGGRGGRGRGGGEGRGGEGRGISDCT